jgi:hypothetical protein
MRFCSNQFSEGALVYNRVGGGAVMRAYLLQARDAYLK